MRTGAAAVSWGKSDPSVVTNTLVKETWKDYQVKSLPVKL